jgi:hypothetical protein
MTANEHKLMVFMFTRQTMLLKSFAEILRSRGVVEQGDIEAFEALVRQQEIVDHELFHAVVDQYSAFARDLGLQGDLPPS